jgi:hypothetical protein
MKVLYVQMWDDFLMQYTGEPPSSRVVTIPLTPEQEKALEPRVKGSFWDKEQKCMVDSYESVHPLSIQEAAPDKGGDAE